MDKYKQKENFKKLILPKISLKDIFNAIKYAKEIKTANEQNLKKSEEIYGFKYFIENPDLSIHECGVSINWNFFTEKFWDFRNSNRKLYRFRLFKFIAYIRRKAYNSGWKRFEVTIT